MGYFGYDTVRFVESRLADSAPKDQLHTPDILLMASDEVAIFDNLSGTLMLVVHVDAAESNGLQNATNRLDQLEAKLSEPVPALPAMDANDSDLTEDAFQSSFGRSEFMAAVENIKDYIMAGDAMQVVPSQRLSAPFKDVHP